MAGLPASFEGTERFQLRRLIGRGGMGIVYEALDHRYGMPVALKLLPLGRSDLLFRFKREFRAAAEIHHLNLVRLGELVAHGEHWFFTMELVHGVDLVSHIRGRQVQSSPRSGLVTKEPAQESGEGQLTVPASAPSGNSSIGEANESLLRAAFVQLVQGLGALHRAGSVHRDVKPSNVLVDQQGRVVVLDFGLASFAPSETTLFGAGTPAYMAPEQVGPTPVEPSADWYSVGVILFELLTGRLPFVGNTHDIVHRKQAEAAPPVRSLAPSAPLDLAQLCDALLDRDAKQRPDGARLLETLDPRARTPEVQSASAQRQNIVLGREAERSQLEQALEEVIAGRGARAVVIFGDSGLGKSTLAQAFMRELAASERVLTFSARCHERELVPYKAVDGIVDALLTWLSRLDGAELAELLPRSAGVLLHAFPVLGRLDAFRLSPEADLSLDRRESRSRLLSAFRQLLLVLSQRQPLVLLIDDLHWGDKDSLALLTETLRAPNAPRLLLLATARMPTSERAPERFFSSEIHEEALVLNALSSESTLQLARLLLEPKAVDENTLARLVQESAGHPLLLRELIQKVLREGTVPSALTIETMLRERFAELSPGPRAVLQVLVIAGAPLDVAVAGEASGVAGSELERAIAELRAVRLVVAVHGVQGERLEPAYERVRTTVLADLDADAVRAEHEHLARALERGGDRIASATHWRAALQTERAAEHYRSAAELSIAALAFDDAAEQYKVALELSDWPADKRRSVELALADALANAGKGADASVHYLAAAEGARLEQRLQLRRRAAEELIWSGRLSEGLKIGRTVLAEAGMRFARFPLLAFLLRRLLLKLRGLSYRERPLSERDPRELERIDLCWSFSSGLLLTDHIHGAYFQAIGVWRALRHGDPYRVVRSLASEAAFVAAYARADQDQTALLLDRADRLAARVDDPRASSTVLMMGGIADHLRGDFKRARPRLETAIRTLRERCTGAIWELDASQQFWLESLFYEGNLPMFREAANEGIRQARVRGSVYAATNLQTGLPNLLWLLDGRVSEARERASEAIALWSGAGFHVQHWYDLMAQTHADLYEGAGVQAHTRVEQAWRALKRSHLLGVNHTRIVATHLRARAALAAAAEVSGAQRARCLALALTGEKTLLRGSAPWGKALGCLIHAGRISVESGRVAGHTLELAQQQVAAAGLGIYAMALDAVQRPDAPDLAIARGVNQVPRLLQMLLPGLCSTVRADVGPQHAHQ